MWINPKINQPNDGEVVLCLIKNEVEVGKWDERKKRFIHTFGSTYISDVRGWIPVPPFTKIDERRKKK
jgi:hypothetical protein